MATPNESSVISCPPPTSHLSIQIDDHYCHYFFICTASYKEQFLFALLAIAKYYCNTSKNPIFEHLDGKLHSHLEWPNT